MRRFLPLLGIIALAGCGSSAHVVRVDAVAFPPLRLHAVAAAHPHGGELPLAEVAPLLPRRLPPSDTCSGSVAVTVELSNHTRRVYRDCRPNASALSPWVREALVGLAVQESAPAPATRVVGGTRAERAALRALVRRIAPTRIRTVRIVSRGSDVDLTMEGGTSLRGEWEGALLGSLYSAAADANTRLRPVHFVTAGDSSGPQSFTGAAGAPFAAAAAARAAGATVVESRSEGGAAVLTIRVDDPPSFLRHRLKAVLDLLPPSAHYIGVEDRHGVLVLASGSLPAEGMLYVRPDLDACSPILHSEPAGAVEPPCPAH